MFKTPVCIDLLLGAEVFTSILRDGRLTGPRGKPSAINTCFGCKGALCKIKHDCDIVDVANYTLEQEVLKNMTGSRRSNAAVFSADKGKDFRRPQRKNKLLVRRPPCNLKRESDHDKCRILSQEFSRLKTSQCARNRELASSKRCRNTSETKGLLQAGRWRHIAIN